MPTQNVITAMQGLFLKLAYNGEMESGWDLVTPEIDIALCECNTDDKSIIEMLCHYAKVESEYPKKSPNNRVYSAHWSSRIADMQIYLKKVLVISSAPMRN